MKIVNAEVKNIYFPYAPGEGEQLIEHAGRVSHKSENRITNDSAGKFVQRMLKMGHTAVLEFGSFAAHIIADRGCTHELVRHRLASFCQESTRYCNYSKGKFDNQITVIAQPGLSEANRHIWVTAMAFAEEFYFDLLAAGEPPDVARSVLPIGLKTEIYIMANLTEWRHIFRLRCSPRAHKIIRGICTEILRQAHEYYPNVFDDLYEQYCSESEDK